MKEPARSLNIPLERRGRSRFLLLLGCVVVALIYVKPNTPSAWVAAIGVMAPTFWLIFVGPKVVSEWESRSQYVFVGWFVVAVKMAIFLFVVSVAVPFVESILTGWLNA